MVSELTAELSKSPPKEPAVGKFELIVDHTKTQTSHVNFTQASVAVSRTAEPVHNGLPTHPLSPGVLSEFPAFKYSTPPVRPQPRPLQVPAHGLHEKHPPLTPSCARAGSTKKGRPSILTLSQLASAHAKVEACRDLTSDKSQK